MGAQDSFPEAQVFQQDTGTTGFTMIWDESFTSWSYYQVRAQPTAILVDRNGDPVKGWLGRYPETEVLELVANL
ncbi:MAG: hypothetical protein HKN03_05470 [Acidimicrobiales bacterium]|nr:hypothetical protein [Acidimicrobiales bacterium]